MAALAVNVTVLQSFPGASGPGYKPVPDTTGTVEPNHVPEGIMSSTTKRADSWNLLSSRIRTTSVAAASQTAKCRRLTPGPVKSVKLADAIERRWPLSVNLEVRWEVPPGARHRQRMA